MLDSIRTFLGNLLAEGYRKTQIESLMTEVAVFERKLADATTRIGDLSAELVNCRATIAQLKSDNHQLASQIPKRDEGPKLDNDAVEILCILFDVNEHMLVAGLCGQAGLQSSVVEHCLSVLDGEDMVNFQQSYMGAMNHSPATAKITTKGTAFVMKYRERN